MKQETLEEAAEQHRYGLPIHNFIRGAKWQQERMYSEEEVLQILASYADCSINDIRVWFEKYKKK